MDFDDDDDNYYQDEEETFGLLKEERNVFERIGIRNIIDIESFEGKKGKKKTRLERFVEKANAVSLQLINENMLVEGDRNIILTTIETIDKPEYKNATAYVLGYVISNGGRNIDKDKLYDVIDILEKLEDKSVTPPDVIRYARLWQNIT